MYACMHARLVRNNRHLQKFQSFTKYFFIKLLEKYFARMNHLRCTRTHTVRWCMRTVTAVSSSTCVLVTRHTEIARVNMTTLSCSHGLMSVSFHFSLARSLVFFLRHSKSNIKCSTGALFVVPCAINLIDSSVHKGFKEMRFWIWESKISWLS